MADRLRCESGEWKTRNQFSRKQLGKYDREARSGRASPANTGIRCLEHSAHAPELKCEGPCGRWRDLQLFSKNTRRNGRNWCLDCTDWQIRTENGETLPPPGAKLSIEEANGRLARREFTGDGVNFDPDADSSDESAFANDDGVSVSVSTSAAESGAGGSVISLGRLDKFVPPHLRHYFVDLIGNLGASRPGSVTTASDATSTIASESTATAGGGQRPGVPFNAWGPNGEFARRVKTPTVVSDTTTRSADPALRQPANQGRKGWAKPPTRKYPPQLPEYLKYDAPVEDNDGDFDSSDDDM